MSENTLNKKIIVSVINDLVTDQRVKRSCAVLTEMGFEVLLTGRRMRHSPAMDNRPYAVKRMKLLFEKGPAFYACFQIRLFLFLLFQKSELLWANDLDTLLPNFLISKIKKVPLIYDSHEYFTGVPELLNRPLKRKIWKVVEKRIFPRLKTVFTVNDSIADLYENEYGIRPVVVRNVPERYHRLEKTDRRALGLPQEKRILILQGSGINVDRGAEEMVEAMQYVRNAVLLIAGSGDVLPKLKEIVKKKKLQDRVIFLPRQPYKKLMQYTSVADLGLTLDKDTNINYRYSLPNKIFDYLQAGIPVLASSLPEIRKIIETYEVGDFIPNHDPEQMAKKVNEIFSDSARLKRWKQNTQRAARELNWENESQILKNALKKYV
jgi:glycosyltransferase involved in cell wall biosynthesis